MRASPFGRIGSLMEGGGGSCGDVPGPVVGSATSIAKRNPPSCNLHGQRRSQGLFAFCFTVITSATCEAERQAHGVQQSGERCGAVGIAVHPCRERALNAAHRVGAGSDPRCSMGPALPPPAPLFPRALRGPRGAVQVPPTRLPPFPPTGLGRIKALPSPKSGMGKKGT